jgi:hypothetical protein
MESFTVMTRAHNKIGGTTEDIINEVVVIRAETRAAEED